MADHGYCDPPRQLFRDLDILASPMPILVNSLTKNVTGAQNVHEFKPTYRRFKSIAQLARMYWRDKNSVSEKDPVVSVG